MRKTLYVKFLLVYLIVGFLGFCFTSTLGANLTRERLKNQVGRALYTEAVSVASDSTVRYQMNTSNLEVLSSTLVKLSAYQSSEIWIMGQDGKLLVNTGLDDPLSSDEEITGFDPTTWGAGYYRTGNFYGHYNYNVLSVIAPITSNMQVIGYVIMHHPMSGIYQNAEELLQSSYILFAVYFGLSLLILLLFTIIVYIPLTKITLGTEEFSIGHLEYQIPVRSNDEMGYLAASLNFMSDELGKTGENQKKFIANVSHDFRSPLTSIKGYVEAMSDGTIPPESQERYLQIILFETNRLEKLTESLLSLNNLDSKTRMLNQRAFDINKAIKNTVASFEGTCRKKRITVELILYGEQLYVYADMEQIQQVLYNLMDNAIKFSLPESSLVIETTERNERIFVSVKDHGVGISKENLNMIWKRFYKTDASRGKDRQGTGLGLSIVKEIIHAHGQTIDVISTQDVGTEFIFTLERAR
ncbi:MAG: sensor histidine kinase [Lachnospiraceae bacterium]